MITRRLLLSGAGLALARVSGFARDFWNDKDPGEWTDRDIQRLLTNSPWSREVSLRFRSDLMPPGGRRGGTGGGSGGQGGQWDPANSGGMGGPPIGVGGGGAGGGRGGGGGGGMRGGGERGEGGQGGGQPELKATVRWESAKPVRDARKKPVRPEDAPFYVISVGALPATEGAWAKRDGMSQEDRRKALEQHLKEVTRLERKNNDPIVADHVVVLEANNLRYLVFYFPRDPHPIVLDDKEVTFVTSLGLLEIRAKFALKNMVARSELAV